MYSDNKKWFTLVELVVVVVIIVILVTVWFIAYNNNTSWARDANRVAQLTGIWDALIQYQKQTRLPLPENHTRLINWTDWNWDEIIFWYQWIIWQTILQAIDFKGNASDPRDGWAFTYLTTISRNNFQLVAFLEDENNIVRVVNQANAQLQNRHIKTFGSRLWVIVEADTLMPLERLNLNTFDLNSWTTQRFRAYVSDNEYVEWTPSELTQLDEVMRDRGRGWRVENNSFICHDLEGIFPCTILAWGDPDPTPDPDPIPTTPWHQWDAEIFTFNASNNNLGLPASNNYNFFNQSGQWFNVTLVFWNTSSTVDLNQGSSHTITWWNWSNVINIPYWWSHSIDLGNWYNIMNFNGMDNGSIESWNGRNEITFTASFQNSEIELRNWDNEINFIWMNNGSIESWNGENIITFSNTVQNSEIDLWDGDNILSFTYVQNTEIDVWDWNNTIEFSNSAQNTLIYTGDGDNTINVRPNGSWGFTWTIEVWTWTNIIRASWATTIYSWTDWSLTIDSPWNQGRTVHWRGWDLTMNNFWRWWSNRINFSQISDLNWCSDFTPPIVIWNWSVATITSSQWTLTLHMQDWQTDFNCSQRFQF